MVEQTASSKMALELRGKLQQYVPKASSKDAQEATSEAIPDAEGDRAVAEKVADNKAEASV